MHTVKRITQFLVVCGLVWAVTAGTATAAQFDFFGDLNHRFLLGTNHNEFFSGGESAGRIDDDDVYDNFGEIKYRFGFEAASDDGDYKGVVAAELGGLRFGEPDKMEYSGDDVQFEARWAYFDFQLPFVEQKSRARVGLQPINVNPFLWKETVGGVVFRGGAGAFDYHLGWMRGYETNVMHEQDEDLIDDQDALYARLDYGSASDWDVGLFGLYQWQDTDSTDPGQADNRNHALTAQDYLYKEFGYEETTGADISLATLGIDGRASLDPFFVNWNAMYQTGSIDRLAYSSTRGLNDSRFGGSLNIDQENYDLDGYFAHMDVGLNWDKHAFTYTAWYASGNDESDVQDGDFNAFMATDIDRMDSIVLMEGGLTDDEYFTERMYIMDRGMIMNKLAWDYQVNEKLKLGLSGMYMLTAEDIEYTAGKTGEEISEDELGVEIDAEATYKMYENVEVGINAGYLAAGDAMDYFEYDQDGDSDEDIWRSTMNIRYKF